MPTFPKPKFTFDYDTDAEIQRLRAHQRKRRIPARRKDKLLVATWNIANFGAQERTGKDLSLIAEILGWFDVVAIQECRENFGHLFDVAHQLRKSYRVIMSDVAGNDERMVFLYDCNKVSLLEEIGEMAFPPSRYSSVKLPGIELGFNGFDRTPYLVSFAFGGTSFILVNVHLYFGDVAGRPKASIQRRTLETYAVAKWCAERKKSPFSFTRELVALGDFNMPKSMPGDPIYDALTKLGLELPEHSTQIASSVSTDAHYDQIAFLPDTTARFFTGLKGVFDYDSVLFPDLWRGGENQVRFRAYLRYYISDHRPMWVQLGSQYTG